MTKTINVYFNDSAGTEPAATLINAPVHYLLFQGAALSLTHMSAAGLIENEVNTIYKTGLAFSESALIKAANS